MEIINNGTDWRQFRKSTHLAVVDVEILENKGHDLVFTIDYCQIEENTNVNGKLVSGVFCYFTDKRIKPFMLNSENKKTLAGFAFANGVPKNLSNMVENWRGLTIQLFINPNVKFKKETTGGVRIRAVQPKQQQQQYFTQDMFEQAKQQGALIEQIAQNYIVTNEIAQQYAEYTKK